MAAADPYAFRAHPDPFDRRAVPVLSSDATDVCPPDRQDPFDSTKPLFDAVHAEDRGGLVALFDHLQRYPEFTVARLDVRVRAASGNWQWREAVASNFLSGEGQRAVHIQWRDTSRRPSAASGASAADDRWQFAASVTDDIISVADCRRQTLFASPALLRVTGYTLSEIQSSDFQGRVHAEDLALVELARDFNLRGQGTRIEFRYRCKNGEYAWLDSQATPVLSDSGNVQQIVVTTRDITLRKAAERGLQQSESHWRTLVQSAPDIIELYSRDGVVQFANRARPGRPLADVVGRSGTQDLAPESCEPFLRALERAWCSGVMADVESQTCLPGQPPAWYWSRITPLPVVGQTERLLVVSRDVTQWRREAEKIAALSSAAHNVAKQIAGQLVASLDRLETVEAALTPGSATAAALRHAQEAIRSAAELAGRLAVLADPMPNRENSVASPATPTASPARQANILLVDDDESVRASLLALLRARGVRVAAAADGQQAIDMFLARADEIDAVVLDQNMPGKNGVSVLGELRAMRPDIKVVISSGDVVEPWETEVDECNRLAFAHKALGPQELIAQLERLLERKL